MVLPPRFLDTESTVPAPFTRLRPHPPLQPSPPHPHAVSLTNARLWRVILLVVSCSHHPGRLCPLPLSGLLFPFPGCAPVPTSRPGALAILAWRRTATLPGLRPLLSPVPWAGPYPACCSLADHMLVARVCGTWYRPIALLPVCVFLFLLFFSEGLVCRVHTSSIPPPTLPWCPVPSGISGACWCLVEA
jgi:hypothetical protein